jgi:hypothetical protein
VPPATCRRAAARMSITGGVARCSASQVASRSSGASASTMRCASSPGRVATGAGVAAAGGEAGVRTADGTGVGVAMVDVRPLELLDREVELCSDLLHASVTGLVRPPPSVR